MKWIKDNASVYVGFLHIEFKLFFLGFELGQFQIFALQSVYNIC